VSNHYARMVALTLCAFAAVGCESLIGLHDHNYGGGAPDAAAGKSGRAGSGGKGAAGAGSSQVAAACKEFCAKAVATCQDQYAIFHAAEDCEPACNLLTADQVRCRADEIAKAASSNEYWDHCQGATIGGSTACGGNCENYCAQMDKVCTGDNRDVLEVQDCVTKCRGLADREQLLKGLPADEPRYNVDRDHEGDTLQCRIVHVTIASIPGNADAHCWHAALAPRPQKSSGAENPCATAKNETAPHCEDYCHIVGSACTGDNKVYENEAQCLAVCKALDPGDVADYEGLDTVGCRKSHAYNALIIETKTHCPHAGPTGAGICGKDCPAYCHLAKAGCADAYKTKFGTGTAADAMCAQSCDAIHDGEPLYTVSQAASTPLACRILAASRALEQPNKAAMFCDAALGGGSCAK
jgi:hypothetical protein